MEKQGILSKIKKWFANFKENSENAKYLDNTIKVKTVTQTDSVSQSKKTFQKELQKGVTEQSKIKEERLSSDILSPTISMTDI